MATYGWLKKTDAIAAVQGRLNSTTFWSADECWVYLCEALRVWSALTECWNQDFAIADAGGGWINTGALAKSPRLRTLTNVSLYTQMQYMLLEPPSGGTWTGTNQFSLADLQFALQKRTQEVIQATACNLTQLSPIATTPGTRRNPLPDTVLELRRVRFLATLPDVVVPVTLTREDTQAFQGFEPGYLQTESLPQSWAIAAEPPLSFDVDFAPGVPGAYDTLALVAGPTFSPPAASLLGIPDDWAWLPMYGALADVLGRESEATDTQRANYCMMRYVQGMEVMKQSNWLVQAQINGVPVDTPSLAEFDDYAPEWEGSAANLPTIVQAGMDFFAPTPGPGQSATLTLTGSAPLLDVSGIYVQVARDDFEAVLNYAQHLASFKMASTEFTNTMRMMKEFFDAAGARNKRLLSMGIFTDVLKMQGERQDIMEER